MRITHPLHLLILLLFPFLLGFAVHDVLSILEIGHVIPMADYLLLFSSITGTAFAVSLLFTKRGQRTEEV